MTVIDLNAYRRERNANAEFSPSRTPLRPRDSAENITPANSLPERLARVRQSLDNINRLLAEIKAAAESQDPNKKKK